MLRQVAIQMKSNRSFVEADAAEDEFAKLPFEIGGIAVGKTGIAGLASAAISTVMRKPEQVRGSRPTCAVSVATACSSGREGYPISLPIFS